ncbi:MAG: DNA repair protein RadC [Caldimicrobium sp.]|nr:DNA repair protein RadC [Caldimicrobium sp.]MCX7613486.1 DNA repair protein RadC [Caldimicrobium sp.]MDW8182942.1 DNA repair protein RadC [Caldimicrobium sp.]
MEHRDKLETLKKRLSRFEGKAQGHRKRVKERFWTDGPESFSDEDLLELLLFFGIPRRDTRVLARELLKRYQGRLDQVLDADIKKLNEIPGLGSKAILPLKVVHEVARRYLKSKSLHTNYLKSPQDVYQYLIYELKGEKREVFMVIYLAGDHRVLALERLFEGTINESAVYPREVFGKAYSYGASHLVLAHNHPSGKLKPSKEDLKITRTLAFTGFLLNLRVIDHLIVGAEGYYSFAEDGIMEEIEREWKDLWKSR